MPTPCSFLALQEGKNNQKTIIKIIILTDTFKNQTGAFLQIRHRFYQGIRMSRRLSGLTAKTRDLGSDTVSISGHKSRRSSEQKASKI